MGAVAAGIFLPRHTYDTVDDYGRHLFHSLAVVQVASSDTALSHVSAAVLHGLRPWRISLDDVHLTRNRPSGSKRSRGG